MEINLSKEIQDRQKDIIKIEDNLTCVVIGVGGIGSWVAMDLALVGVKNLILVDPDRIEATNLNRTLFKLEDIGRLKVDALKSLIEERRNDITVITHDERFEEKMLKRYAKANFFFDCTDNLRTKDIVKESKPENYLKLGYDGFEVRFL